MKKRVVALFLTALMAVTAVGCGGNQESKKAPVVTVSGILPAQGDVIVSTTYIGEVTPQESLTVYPMVSGNVTELNAAVNKQVKAGEALLNVDNTEAARAVEEAQLEYDTIKKAADQAKKDAEAVEKEAEDAKKNAASTTLELIKSKVTDSTTALADAKEYLNDAEDELENLTGEETGSLSLTSSERTKLKQYIEDAQGKMTTVESNLGTIETKLSELEIEKEKLSLLNNHLSEAKTKIKEAKASLSAATGQVKNSMSKDDREDYIDDVKDAKDDIAKITDSVNKVKNNLPTTATAKKTTGGTGAEDSTTTTKVSTTVSTAYDQQLLQAEKKLNEAKALLSQYQVTAPFDGIIEAVYIEKNQKVFEDTPCVVVSNRTNLEVTFHVPESAAKALTAGEKIIVEKDGAMNEASITEVGMMADPQTNLFLVKASLGNVSGYSTGSSVKIYAETQKALGVMKIPYDALYFQGGAAYVYCIVDDEAVRREVQVGLMNEEAAEIKEGLTPEDIVISTWSSQLKDGADVELLFVIGYEEPNSEEDWTTDGTLDVTEESENDTESENGTDEEAYQWVLQGLD